jgi:hypothetical protein
MIGLNPETEVLTAIAAAELVLDMVARPSPVLLYLI